MAVRETLELDITRAMAQVQTLGAAYDKALSGSASTQNLGNLQQGLAGAGNAAATAAGQTDQLAEAHKRASSSAANHSESLRATSSTMLVFGAAVTAAIGGAVFAFASLESALAPIGTLLGATTAEAQELSGELTNVIASSPQSAEEIGMSAYTILSAGIQGTANVLKTLDASQKLAEAGLGDLGGATNIVTSAMNSFTEENLTAKAAAQGFFGAITLGKTTTADLAQGFGQIAPLAAAAGVSFKELLASTAALTGTGQQASVAYSGLRGVLTGILRPTADAQAAARQLGIDFSVTRLQSVGLAQFLDEVGRASGGNVDTLTKLFGSVEGLNAVLALTGPQAESFARNLEGIDKAGQGLDARAQEIENTVNNRLRTAFNALKVDLAQAIAPAIPLIEGLVDAFGAVGSSISDLPGPTQLAGAAFIAFVGASALTLGATMRVAAALNSTRAFLLGFHGDADLAGRATTTLANNLGLVTRAAAGLVAFPILGQQLQQLGLDFTTAGAAAGALVGTFVAPGLGTVIGGVLGGIAGAVGLLGEEVDDTDAKVEKLVSSLNELEGAGARREFFQTLGFSALQLGRDYATLTTGVQKLADQYGSLEVAQTVVDNADKRTQAFAKTFKGLADDSPANARKVLDALQGMLPPDIFEALEAQLSKSEKTFRRGKETADDTAKANNALAGSMAEVGGAAGEAADDVNEFAEAIDKVTGPALSAEEADIRWTEALRTLGDELAENNRTLEIGTEAGNKNRQALLDLTKAALGHATAVAEQTGSWGAAEPVLNEHIGSLIRQAEALGFDTTQVYEYVAGILGIPPAAVTDIINSADPAKALVDRYVLTILGVPPDKHTDMINNAAAAGVPVSEYVNLTNQAAGSRTTTFYANTGPAEAAASRLIATYGSVEAAGAAAGVYAQHGMIVPATPGGMHIIAGEAGFPEVVLPTNDDAQAIRLLRAAGLGRLLGTGRGGTSVSAPVSISVHATGNRTADLAAGRAAGAAAARELLQRIRAS